MLEEFLDFLSNYNIIWITLGLIIATKIAELTKSFIEDLIMPLLFWPLLRRLKVNKLENLSYKGILYGKVIAKAIDFLVIAFTLFLIIKYAHIQLPA